MADMNIFVGTGRLTRDAVKKTVGKYELVECSVANNTGFGDKQKTNFYKLNLWGKAGTGVLPYLKKGQMIGFQGQQEINEWGGQDNVMHKDVVINGTCILMGGAPKQEEPEDDGLQFEDTETF